MRPTEAGFLTTSDAGLWARQHPRPPAYFRRTSPVSPNADRLGELVLLLPRAASRCPALQALTPLACSDGSLPWTARIHGPLFVIVPLATADTGLPHGHCGHGRSRPAAQCFRPPLFGFNCSPAMFVERPSKRWCLTLELLPPEWVGLAPVTSLCWSLSLVCFCSGSWGTPRPGPAGHCALPCPAPPRQGSAWRGARTPPPGSPPSHPARVRRLMPTLRSCTGWLFNEADSRATTQDGCLITLPTEQGVPPRQLPPRRGGTRENAQPKSWDQVPGH